MIPNTIEDLTKLLNILTKKTKLTSYSLSINKVSMIQDWLIYGNKNQHIDYWSIQPIEQCHEVLDPIHAQILKISARNMTPEHVFFLCYSYKNHLGLSAKDLSNPNLICKYFDFLIKEIIENNINITMWIGRKNECDIKNYGTIDKTHFINY
jgi:hypothetical protein